MREDEQDSLLTPKVRLRAQEVLRLSGGRKWSESPSTPDVVSSQHLAKPRDRWEVRRLDGLADGTTPGNPPRISGEVRAFLGYRLREQRTWNVAQMAQALEERFGMGLSPEAIRQHLPKMD